MLKNKFPFTLLILFLALASLSFAKGILITKEPSAAYFLLGKHYFNKNDFDSAISYFKKSAEANPDFAEAYHDLGVAFYYNGNSDSAISSFKKSLEIKKDYAKAHYSIALIYYEIKDFDSAIFHLSKAVQLDSRNANAHFDLAVAYAGRFREKESGGSIASSDLEDLKEAVKNYHSADELKQGFPHALSNAEIVEGVIAEYGKINSASQILDLGA